MCGIMFIASGIFRRIFDFSPVKRFVISAPVIMGLSGAIAGGVDTFLSKNKAKTWDAKLAKMTKWVAIVFMVLTLVLCLI